MSRETAQHESERRWPSRQVWIVIATILAIDAVVGILALLWPDLVFPSSGQSSDWAISSPEEQGYRADGLYEQHIYVLPDADMVVVVTADICGVSFYRVDGLVNAFILPASTDLPAPAPRAACDAHGFTFEYPTKFLDGGTLPAVSGVWICDVSGRAFAVTYLTAEEMTPEGLLAALERYLEGLACH